MSDLFESLRPQALSTVMKVSMWVAAHTNADASQLHDAITNAITDGLARAAGEEIQVLNSNYVVAKQSDMSGHINDGYLTFTTNQEEKE